MSAMGLDLTQRHSAAKPRPKTTSGMKGRRIAPFTNGFAKPRGRCRFTCLLENHTLEVFVALTDSTGLFFLRLANIRIGRQRKGWQRLGIRPGTVALLPARFL